MTNSADPDQLASEESEGSGSTLFAKVGHIRVQQDQCYSIWLRVNIYSELLKPTPYWLNLPDPMFKSQGRNECLCLRRTIM